MTRRPLLCRILGHQPIWEIASTLGAPRGYVYATCGRCGQSFTARIPIPPNSRGSQPRIPANPNPPPPVQR